MKRPALVIAAVLTALSLPMTARAENGGPQSREYKLGLDPDALPGNPEAAIAAVSRRLERVGNLEFKKPKQAEVQFFDTPDCSLTRASMLLRSRARPRKVPQITLKIRNRDIRAVEAVPIGLARAGETAFQDDYGLGPDGRPASSFSRSLSFEADPPKTLAELAGSIRNLGKVVPFRADAPLKAGPLIAQTAYVAKPLPLGGDRKIRLEATFWYPASGGKALAGDISFTLEMPLSGDVRRAADGLLVELATALGPLKGVSGEKSLAAIPSACRIP